MFATLLGGFRGGFTRVYKGLQGFARPCEGFTRLYKGFTRLYKGLQGFGLRVFSGFSGLIVLRGVR